MRKTLHCPKCEHDQIVYLPHIRHHAETIPLPCLAVATGLETKPENHFFKGRKDFGFLEAYICFECGYTELYTKDVKGIPIDLIEGAKLLKGPGSAK